MRESNTHATNEDSNIQCLEVLIPKFYISNNVNNLFWTLSVYSLENQPVQKSRPLHNSEIFHFMVYDWKRTIKQLLDNNQVPYSIIRLFSPDNIYSDKPADLDVPVENEVDYVSDVDDRPDSGLYFSPPSKQSKLPRREIADLIK